MRARRHRCRYCAEPCGPSKVCPAHRALLADDPLAIAGGAPLGEAELGIAELEAAEAGELEAGEPRKPASSRRRRRGL